MKIRIGTRKSNLALIQTDIVINKIKEHFPECECIIVPIITTGDKITDRNLYDIGGKALFLKEIEEQLLNNEIDIAVHSLKDVPGNLPVGLEIAAVLEREDARDCFVSFKYKSIAEMPIGSVIGSSSVRRKVIINNFRPDIEIVQFRGNINTRLKKLYDNEVDATILACAGLNRSNLFDLVYCSPINYLDMLPAAGQGIIGIETRSDNELGCLVCKAINHKKTWQAAKIERDFLSYLDASCRTPMSAYARIEDEMMRVSFMLSNISGSQMEYLECSHLLNDIEQLGVLSARKLKQLFPNYEKDVLGL